MNQSPDESTEPPSDRLDDLDRKLLNRLQAGLPLVADPFAALAAPLGLLAEELLDRVRRLKRQGIIRQISAIFDTAAMGYASSLVAGRVPPDRIAPAAEVINRHPGVTHNYRRNHDYNLWFTIAVPPDSRLGLERTVAILARQSGAAVFRVMPALRVFKIGLQLDMTDRPSTTPSFSRDTESRRSRDGGERAVQAQVPPDEFAAEGYGESDRAEAAKFPLTRSDIAAVRVLQDDLAISRTPFDGPAGGADLSVEELLAAAGRMHNRRQMRRFAAVLRHRAAGFAANAMGVWVVPDELIEQVGRQLAGFPSVSHCYQRPTWPDWPFNVFTMVHGRSPKECEAELSAMRTATGIQRMAVLYSLEEYKKTRLRYFTGEIERWEAENGTP